MSAISAATDSSDRTSSGSSGTAVSLPGLSGVRLVPKTAYPAVFRARATALPSPPDAPVTRAVLVGGPPSSLEPAALISSVGLISPCPPFLRFNAEPSTERTVQLARAVARPGDVDVRPDQHRGRGRALRTLRAYQIDSIGPAGNQI